MRCYVLFIPVLYILKCYFAHVCVHFCFVISVNIPLIIMTKQLRPICKYVLVYRCTDPFIMHGVPFQ